MLEMLLAQLRTVDPVWIYLTVVFFAFIENIFPPSPSDVVVIVGASLIASTTLSFAPVVLATSVASALGFMVMFLLGRCLGEKVVRKGRLGFLSLESLARSELWFGRYGYWFIAANRFLPGTRSVISFASGVLETESRKTFACALLSALLWNSLIIYVGMQLGANVRLIDRYLTAYHRVIILITAAAVVFFLLRWLVRRRRRPAGGGG